MIIMGEREKFDWFSGEGIIVFDESSKSIEFENVNIPCGDLEFDGWSDDTKGGLIAPTPNVGCVSFSCNLDKSYKDFLHGEQVPNKASFVITSESSINRPKNLKHPNKKRARRVWNKWRKRYGIKVGKGLVVPNAEFDITTDGTTIKMTAYAQDCHKER